MERGMRFLLVGGDRRFCRLGDLLRADGHRVTECALGAEDNLPEETQDVVILPIPPEDEGGLVTAPLSGRRIALEGLLALLPRGQRVLSGGWTPLLRQKHDSGALWVRSYLEPEGFRIANSIATAEGAICIAVQETARTLHGRNALVIGGGRCGTALARRLAALGAKVTVSVRSWKDEKRVEESGWQAANTGELSEVLNGAELVFNTVPALVLDRGALERLKRDVPVIDLASGGAGVDWQAAQELGRKAIRAGGLPGRFSPQTAAEDLRDSVYFCLEG